MLSRALPLQFTGCSMSLNITNPGRAGLIRLVEPETTAASANQHVVPALLADGIFVVYNRPSVEVGRKLSIFQCSNAGPLVYTENSGEPMVTLWAKAGITYTIRRFNF
ncbi:hypothetical protein J6590_048237 [Homalodisca vitripennis]|nr:hypothetical protein J6590_048237 [Homalodisca vitripennis]